MATAPDRRMRWTREALQDALLALMSEKGYEAVTVQDIIERADVAAAQAPPAQRPPAVRYETAC